MELIVFGTICYVFCKFVGGTMDYIGATLAPEPKRYNWSRIPLYFRMELYQQGVTDLEEIRKAWTADPRNQNF